MDNFKIIDGKKFGWDGENYESESAAQEKIMKYNNDGFNTELIEEDDKYFVFTRRLAAEIVVEGKPV